MDEERNLFNKPTFSSSSSSRKNQSISVKQPSLISTNNGFTLPELLIVIAIIAVLVAIAIPVFSGQLESSRQAADLASIRDAYAEAAGDALLNGGKDGVAETGLMKHTGLFSRLGEAHIGNLDLKTNDADPIVKDYTVMVTVSAVDGSVKLNVGNGGHLLGKTVTADEIQALKDEFHKATNTQVLLFGNSSFP